MPLIVSGADDRQVKIWRMNGKHVSMHRVYVTCLYECSGLWGLGWGSETVSICRYVAYVGSLLLIATQPDGLIFVFECVGMYPSGTALVVV